MTTSVIVNFRGTNIIVTGHAPYMFEEDAETVGAKVLIKSASFNAPYDSAEHLVGRASGWGMQKGKISNSVHFYGILEYVSEKIGFSDIELYISNEEYARIKEIITAASYSKADFARDTQMYLMGKYGVILPSTVVNNIADEFYNDGCVFDRFFNGFYATEAHMCRYLDLDPNDLVKALWSGNPVEGPGSFWNKLRAACKAKNVQVISPR